MRVKPLLAAKPPPPMKVMLTKKEIKRMRKRNRAEVSAAARRHCGLSIDSHRQL